MMSSLKVVGGYKMTNEDRVTKSSSEAIFRSNLIVSLYKDSDNDVYTFGKSYEPSL